MNLPHLDDEDTEERRRAAMAIRTAYHHGLESFFALLFATLQAPFCVAGWMQVYSPAGLRDIVRSADPGLWGVGERREQVVAFREKLLPFLWLRPRSFVGWEGVSRAIHRLDIGQEEAARTQERFGDDLESNPRRLQNLKEQLEEMKQALQALQEAEQAAKCEAER